MRGRGLGRVPQRAGGDTCSPTSPLPGCHVAGWSLTPGGCREPSLRCMWGLRGETMALLQITAGVAGGHSLQFLCVGTGGWTVPPTFLPWSPNPSPSKPDRPSGVYRGDEGAEADGGPHSASWCPCQTRSPGAQGRRRPHARERPPEEAAGLMRLPLPAWTTGR